MLTYDRHPLIVYLDDIETCVSPARHLPADKPGVITGGFGNTDPHQVKEGMLVPIPLAVKWRNDKLDEIQQAIEDRIAARNPSIILTQGKMLALLDFGYNEGIGSIILHTGLLGSSLFNYVLWCLDSQALAEFQRWDIANGKHLLGLLKRRHIEENWYATAGVIV